MNSKDYFGGDELANIVWLNKYAALGETSPDQMHWRMAKEFGRIEKHYLGKIDHSKVENLSIYGRKRLYNLLNTNVDQYFFDLMKDFKRLIPQGSVMSTLGTDVLASLSNCIVVPPPYDSYAGILWTDQELVQLYKRRCGVGTGLWTLRPKGASTNNTARNSTGSTSFAPRFSNSTREAAQEGRRGALMLAHHIAHPDIEDFIESKKDLKSISGANISPLTTNEFMEAVEGNEEFTLRFPIDKVGGKYDKTIQARELFQKIVENAHHSGDPGLLFIDHAINYSPDGVYDKYRPILTNPCGEQWLQAYDACRLLIQNMFSIVINPFGENAQIDFQLLYENSYELTVMGDNLVDLEIEYIDRILEKIQSDPEPTHLKVLEIELWEKLRKQCKDGRRVGAGFTALADMLAALGQKYASEESLGVLEEVLRVKFEAEMDATIDLAILRGTFEGWDAGKEYLTWHDHEGVIDATPANAFYKMVVEELPHIARRMYKYGRRNVSTSTVAPCGSTSIVAKLVNYHYTSGGCEPQFSCYYFRNRKINPNDKDSRVDFVDEVGDSWQVYPVVVGAFKEWLKVHYVGDNFEEWLGGLSKKEMDNIYKESPWYSATANEIDWKQRIKTQAIIQKYTTNAVSSTVNLPSDVSVQTVYDIYMEAWKQGLKGITIYRDGSKGGVLNHESKLDAVEFDYVDAPKRPEQLPCDIHHTQIGENKYTVLVGLYVNKPFEVFVIPENMAVNHKQGFIKKYSSGEYALTLKEDDVIPFRGDITAGLGETEEALCRIISGALRHRMDIKFIVEQLNKVHGGLFSFAKVMARVFKKYIPEGAKATLKELENCSKPGECNIVYQEGCVICSTCGNSKC